MEYIINHPEIKATTNDNWQFTPRDIVEPAAKRDRELLFGK